MITSSRASSAPAEFRDAHLRGVWAAIPVPWNADGSVDRGAMRALVGRYRDFRVDGVYSTGTDGEFHVLELGDFRAVQEAFASAVDDVGIPAQAGASWINERGIHERIAIARDLGFRCVQTTVPFWMPINDLEARDFFAGLTDRFPDVGIVSYNTSRSGHQLTPAEMRDVVDRGSTLIGAKHEGTDDALMEAAALVPEMRQFAVDGGILPGVLYGATGMYSFIVNVSPSWTMEFWRNAVDGDWEEAARKKQRLNTFLPAFEAALGSHVTAWPSQGKAAIRAGLFPDMPLGVRSPYRAATEADVARVRTLIETQFPEFGIGGS